MTNLFTRILGVLLFFAGIKLQAQTLQTNPYLLAKTQSLMQANALAFEENKGQVQGADASKVRFTVKAPGIDIFIFNNGIAYQYKKVHYPDGYEATLKEHKPEAMAAMQQQTDDIRTETFRMDAILVGTNPNSEVVTEGRSMAVTHYYNHDALNVEQYQKIIYKNIYPLIDWQLLFKNGQLEYEFVVHPGGNPDNIRFRYAHTEGLALQQDGSLQLQSSMGNVTDHAPVSFQDRTTIKTAFVLEGKELRFQLAAYDPKQTLVIDPTLQWGTYYGGTGTEYGQSCATDAVGNVYVAGYTSSATTIASGGHQNTYGSGTYDAFLVKFSSIGTRLWATYYGGTGNDYGYSCATDASGNVYLTGYTTSTAGISSGGHQNVIGGGQDAFLVKLNSNGSFEWGTYYGGTGTEYGYSCATDALGNVYLAGYTSSSTIIISGGHQNSFGGGTNDAFLVKFNSSGTRLWDTYYGGTDNEYGHGCATDGSGNIYLSGNTNSSSGIAAGGHQNSFGGGTNDAFLVKFNSTGTRLWATYYGGTNNEYGHGCATDGAGNIYLSGYTNSTNSIAVGGHQNTLGGDSDAFLVKFDNSGIRQWATYYGGVGSDLGYSCVTDGAGNIYLSGYTSSFTDIASSGHQNTLGGILDGFLVKFNSAGTRQWGTYYGGNGIDMSFGSTIDASGNVYITGQTTFSTNMASAGHQNVSGGGSDAFLAKFAPGGDPLPLNLLSFKAVATADHITQLYWTTAQEEYVHTISVERSTNTTNWETITVLDAKGGMHNSYGASDLEPHQGMNLYRLRMTDLDGSYTHSKIEKVYFDHTTVQGFSIYPNPAKGSFTIEWKDQTGTTTDITVTDVSGKIIYYTRVTGTKQLRPDITLQAGVYLVTLMDGDKSYTQKLVVE